MAIKINNDLKRILIPRRRSLVATEEREESELRSMVNSFERSLSPKFILGKKLSISKIPLLTKPISLKIEKKILPVYTAPQKSEMGTLNDQIKQLKVFTKTQKSKDTPPMPPRVLEEGTNSTKILSIGSQETAPGSMCSYNGIIINPRKTFFEPGSKICKKVLCSKPKISDCSEAMIEKSYTNQNSNNNSSYKVNQSEIESRNIEDTLELKSILKKGVHVRTNSSEMSMKRGLTHSRNVSFSKYRECRFYSPQL